MTDPLQTQQRPWYITTAIPYVNAKPHIGFALELVLTDTLARYHRLRGEDVRFLTGTDENSLSNVRAAERAGLSPQPLVDRNAALFFALRERLNLSFDDFIRTSVDRRHWQGVHSIWRACERSGDIYKRSYQGLYCVGCEQFYTEEELNNGCCPEHQTRPELIDEENYFFRLSKYADRLRELIEPDQLRIIPPTRKNEVLGLLRRGLTDFSISRSQERARGWGIPVPDDPAQVIYVWFDALANYLTALDVASSGSLYQRYWTLNPHRIHVIGKGILRFHAVYWPAILLSAGLPLPTTLVVHGYVTVDGAKISKSLGNTIDPVELVECYGVDPLRYYLLRAIPPSEDGEFTLERFIRLYNADLADQLGNLLNRVVRMVDRYYAGIVPQPEVTDQLDIPLLEQATRLAGRLETTLTEFDPQSALDAIWALIASANKYVVAAEPWKLATQQEGEGAQKSKARLATVLYNLHETLRLVAHACAPFLPDTAKAIADQLGVELVTDAGWSAALRWGGCPLQTSVRPGRILFPRYDEQ